MAALLWQPYRFNTAGSSSNPSILNRQGAANRPTIRCRRMDRLLNILFFHRGAATKCQADDRREENGAEAVGGVMRSFHNYVVALFPKN